MAYTQAKKIISPAAVAAPWPKLTTPDSYQNGALTYKAGLILDLGDEGVQQYINQLDDAAEDAYQAAIATIDEELESATGKKLATLRDRKDNLKKHVPYGDQYAEDGTTTGRIIVRYKRNAEGEYRSGKNVGKKWTATVPCFDAAKKPLSESDGTIMGGSILRIQAEMVPFTMLATSTAGVSLRIFAVQVIEMEGGSEAAGSGFDVEDGYQASEVERVVAKEAPAADEDDDSGDF